MKDKLKRLSGEEIWMYANPLFWIGVILLIIFRPFFMLFNLLRNIWLYWFRLHTKSDEQLQYALIWSKHKKHKLGRKLIRKKVLKILRKRRAEL